MTRIKNVILDWSGTLVDDFQPVLEATNEIFAHYGKPKMSEEAFREKFFLPFPDFYQRYLPEATLAELEHHYHTAFKLLGVQLLPEAREFLEFCKKEGFALFLLSTIHREYFEVQSVQLDIHSFFTQAYTQAIDKRKTILHLLADHDLCAEETLFVGDMLHDIETAHHGGVMSCAVLTGYDSLEKLKGAQPDLVVRSLGELQKHLERKESDDLKHHPIATVGALIFNAQGQVLMLKTHKWSHLWGIPGGKIKLNEPSEVALRREVLEETGLTLDSIKFQIVQDCVQPPEFYKTAHFILLNYTAQTSQMEICLNDEAEAHSWCSMEEALELPLNTPTRLLLDYVRSHQNPGS